jgi:enediyne biosynthesis protein E4
MSWSIARRDAWIIPPIADPRWIFVCFLGAYVLLGHFVLSFNRSPQQMIAAVVTCTFLDMLYTWVSVRKFLLPLSALISAFGLIIIFSAPGATWLMILASWICITAKNLVTWRGHHIYNPTNFAVVMMILVSRGQASVAPAYQWSGNGWITLLVLSLGLIMMSRVNKVPAVLSFWFVFTLGAFLRSYMGALPFDVAMWATVSGGEFMLYSFFMITDPKTSPSTRKGMILYGAAIGFADMGFQLASSIYSFFYAAVFVGTCRFAITVGKDFLEMRRAASTVDEQVPTLLS